ncbi:MAG: TlpA disulfide reductase family protein [Rhodanobacteraceae bacterium]
MNIALSAALCFQIALTALATSATAGTTLTEKVSHPKLSVATLSGSHFDLATERGHWVIVNFWATWCSPCIKEMPELSAFVSSHAKVRAIGLDFEETERADVEAFLKKHPVVYPIARVDTAKPPADFGAPEGLPTTYLIAPDGSMAKRFIGPITAHDLDVVMKAWKPSQGS